MFGWGNKRKKDQKTLQKKVFHSVPRNKSGVRIQKPFDVYLFFTTLLLLLAGVIMIFSASAILAEANYNDTYYFLKKEIIFIVLGFILLFTAKTVPYKYYTRWIYPILGFTFICMLLTFIPGLSHAAKGATRWISLFGFTLQPSEFAKLSVVVFTAYMIAKKEESITQFTKGVLPIIVITGAFLVLILAQRDLGSVLVLSAVIFIMLFVAGTRMRFLFGLLLLITPGIYYFVFSVSFRRQRILAFLDPWKYQQDFGYQIIQSFLAFNSGGVTGMGLGEGKQKLFYLPEAHTDFIFSVLGEEFGMIGVVVIAMLFLFLVFRGLKIALKTNDSFGMMLALGLTCLLGLEAFINFGVVMGLLPTKGLALPFISYGGSSLLASMIAIGIILNVSTHTGEEL